MGTIRGANALGCADVTGSLTPGKSADIVVIPVDATARPPKWVSVFESDVKPSAVMTAGKALEQDRDRGV